MSGLRSTAGRWTGRAGTVAFVLAALALARVVGDSYPAPMQQFAQPHEVRATVGEPAHLRTLDVTVDDVRLGRSFSYSSSLYETPGVFVMVDVTFTPTLKDATVAYAELVDAQGRSYTRTRADTNLCQLVAPGITSRCSIALEIPAEAAPGAVLRLGHDGWRSSFDSLLVLDLGLDAAEVSGAAPPGRPLRPLDPWTGTREEGR